MKKIFCLMLILLASLSVSAQEKTIDRLEFDAIYKGSTEKWKGKQHRLTVINQSRAEGRPQTDYSSKAVFEFGLDNAARTLLESTYQSVTSKSEAIRIGGKNYSRKGNEKWQEAALVANAKFDNSSEPKNSRTSTDNMDESRVEYKYLGTEILNNQTATVYTVIENKKGINSKTGKESVSSTITKYWFGKDGMILKSDRINEGRNGEMIFHFRSTMAWESDSNIKIEAPSLN